MLLERIGSWFDLTLDGVLYVVLIQLDTDKKKGLPKTTIIFNEDLTEMITDPVIMGIIKDIMSSMDWETEKLKDC